MNKTDELITFLTDQFDLSDTEAQLYIGLLKRGPSTIMEIAKFTGINRATTHINVEDLIKYGLVTQTKKPNSKRRVVVAEPPEKFELILKQRKLKVDKALEGMPGIISGLSKMADGVSQSSEIEIKYYKGREEVGNIYDEVLLANEVRSYLNATEVFKFFPENLEKFSAAHKSNPEMKMWEILSSKDEVFEGYSSDLDNSRYFFKFFPDDVDIKTVDYIIFDKKLAIISAEDEPSGVMLDSYALYTHSKEIFDFVWSMI
ncbi:winged helix DNA-binding protein [Candidatus Dojkabacteria bacterium]|nr:winged helix DNA-binding protein [Candidatus Dojkabacteria bacterium]